MGNYYIDNNVTVGNVYTGLNGAQGGVYSSEQRMAVKEAGVLGGIAAAKEAAVGEKELSLSDEQKILYEEVIKDEGKMNSITETLNKFMAQWNANLQFSLHRDTAFLMVRFVDLKNNKVLKEFPPEKYLDMIANIRKFIGAIVDEKV
jgi:flagellar protein FlaG